MVIFQFQKHLYFLQVKGLKFRFVFNIEIIGAFLGVSAKYPKNLEL